MPSAPPAAGEVHVWSAGVASAAVHAAALRAVLDAGERRRADRFHFERDRTQYVVAHGLLRIVLGAYAQAPPAALRFVAGPFGKPALAVPRAGAARLAFNLSHSGDRVLIAVSCGADVGVDVERWRDIEHEELAASFFSPAECAELRALPPAERSRGFYACWSRKEAYLKALGIGIGRGLDFFDVTVTPDAAPRVVSDRLSVENAGRWALHALDAGVGYSAALCTPSAVRRVRTFQIPADAGARPGFFASRPWAERATA